MTYNTKAVIIETTLIIASVTIEFILNKFLRSRGLENIAKYSIFFPLTVIGFYTLFGKYICISGLPITKPLRIVIGLFFLLITPVIWFITGVIMK
jgi:hypothetical protein